MFPTFIGIGAQRAGTGWLYRNLLKHPDIWFAPVKELHYFDKLNQPHTLGTRLLSASWRRQCAARLLRDSLPRSRGTLGWDFRYFFGRRSDDWYSSLFSPDEGQICGEITPAYSILDAGAVSHVRKIMPDVRIIFLMRDPVTRVWSHAINRMIRREKREFSEISDERFIELIDSEGSHSRTSYLRTIDTWEEYFPRDQIFYGFYDDLVGDPGELLTAICGFLGISAEKLQLDGSQKKQVKPKMGTRFEMPMNVKTHAAKKYHADLVKLSARFGGHAERWLSDAGSIIDDAAQQVQSSA